jgi:hypothetical protein
MKQYTRYRVQITEKAPKAEQIEQLIKNDPARLPGIVRHWIKDRERIILFIEKAKKRIEPASQGKQRKTAAKYEMIRRFDRQLIAADPKLQRASTNQRAIKIHKQRPDWPVRTIRRALTTSK